MADKNVKRIFLVDDDDGHNVMLKEQLSKRANLEVITFNNGEDCVKNLHLNPSYIFLDYYLNSVKRESLNGIEILKQIKMILPDVFVIMLSAQDKIEIAVDSIKFGAYDYVVKNQSSFLRLENILNNIEAKVKIEKKASAYKNATISLSVVLTLIIIAAFVFKIYHNV